MNVTVTSEIFLYTWCFLKFVPAQITGEPSKLQPSTWYLGVVKWIRNTEWQRSLTVNSRIINRISKTIRD